MPNRPSLSSSISALSLATILSLGGPLAGSAAIAVVSTSNDAGPGSFRDAIATANGYASITQIVFLPSVNTIELQGTVFFTGWQDLVIDGNNAILDGRNAGGTAFVVSGGGDLSVSDLTVRNAPAEGITYAVPGGATGTLRIVLDNVTIQNNVGHGVWIAVQVENSALEGVQPPDAGSDVSLDVTVIGSRFLDNGNDPDRSVSDRDGLRVDEGGNGDLTFTIEGPCRTAMARTASSWTNEGRATFARQRRSPMPEPTETVSMVATAG